MSRNFVALLVAWAGSIATVAHADVAIYTDALQNNFLDYSYGGSVSFTSTVQHHGGTQSIAFSAADYAAVKVANNTTLFDTASYPRLQLWFYGSAAQCQGLDLILERDNGAGGDVTVASSALSAYANCAAIVAGTWFSINVDFTAAPMSYNGTYSRISLFNHNGGAFGPVYFDDLSLLVPANDRIFKNGFEAAAAPAQFRGTTIAGMESGFNAAGTQHICLQPGGPVAGTDYPVQDTRLIDYFAGKGISMLRPLFAWECMQPVLSGSIPGAGANYQAYFNVYKMMVDYATNTQGIGIIIEPWESNSSGEIGGAMWNGNLVGSAQVPRTAFADFWSRMATIFKDNPRVSYGLMSEPNHMSTASWFASAQAAITAIRATGSTQRIYVPGNAYTGASTWLDDAAYGGDTDVPPHSNAYGWLNANGAGMPLSDPLNNIAVEVHTYVDCYQGGLYDEITSNTAARNQLDVTVQWARPLGLPVYLGEIGIYAGNNPVNNPDPGCAVHTGTPVLAWADFISYADANTDTLAGFTWWAGGYPGWWDIPNGPYFSITPTNAATFTGDSIEMTLIQGSF
jgi:endoglucanase